MQQYNNISTIVAAVYLLLAYKNIILQTQDNMWLSDIIKQTKSGHYY